MRLLIHILVAASIASATFAQSTWRVDANATPPGNGSAGQPYSDLQFALAHASTVSGDTLLVEPGTYIGPFDYLGKSVIVRSTQGAAVTILDGNDQLVSVVSFVNGEGPSAVLDGFTITRGRGSPSIYPPLFTHPAQREGGGIRCANSSPTLTNLRVVNNRSARGAGVLLLNSAAVLSRSTISDNWELFAHVQGLGIYSNLQTAVIESCTIENNPGPTHSNFAALGGGFCGRAVVRNTVFRGNRAAAGAGAFSFGATFDRCTFEQNSAEGDCGIFLTTGGGISHLTSPGGPLFSLSGVVEGPTLVTNCLFASNRADQGGGAWCRDGSTLSVSDSVFTGNAASMQAPSCPNTIARFGGAVMGVTVVDCELTGNSAEKAGGALYSGSATGCAIHGNWVSGFPFADPKGGGGAFASDLIDCDVFDNSVFVANAGHAPFAGGGSYGGTAFRTRYFRNTAEYGGGVAGGTLEHCVFFENTATISGGSMAATQLHPSSFSINSVSARNIIARSGVPDEVSQQGSAIAVISYSDVQGGYPGTGNFDADPLFFAPHSDDFHLKPGSPCIDAGDPSSPLDANGSPADVGAWPFDASYCSSPGVWCAGKPNSQGCVPAMGFSGTPSATGADNFFVTGSNFLGANFGLMAWSRTPNAIPFQGGTLCIAGPFFRAGLQFASGTSGVCDGTYSFHFSQSYRAAFGINTYETIYAQWFARDALNPDGTGWSLSNAIEFTICP